VIAQGFRKRTVDVWEFLAEDITVANGSGRCDTILPNLGELRIGCVTPEVTIVMSACRSSFSAAFACLHNVTEVLLNSLERLQVEVC